MGEAIGLGRVGVHGRALLEYTTLSTVYMYILCSYYVQSTQCYADRLCVAAWTLGGCCRSNTAGHSGTRHLGWPSPPAGIVTTTCSVATRRGGTGGRWGNAYMTGVRVAGGDDVSGSSAHDE